MSRSDNLLPKVFLKMAIFDAFSDITGGSSSFLSHWNNVPLRTVYQAKDYHFVSPLLKILNQNLQLSLSSRDLQFYFAKNFQDFTVYVDQSRNLVFSLKSEFQFEILRKNFLFLAKRKFIFLRKVAQQDPVLGNFVEKKISLEYVSANPTGFIHLGHLRNGVIGQQLSYLYLLLGNRVRKVFFLNDLGEQMTTFSQEILDYFQKKKNVETRSVYLNSALTDLLKKSGLVQAIVNESSKKIVIRLLTHFMRLQLQKQLSWLRIFFDAVDSESLLYKSSLATDFFCSLEKKKSISLSQDAVWLKIGNYFDQKDDKVLVKRNWKTTYFLSDIIYHLTKLKADDTVIGIFGADHADHLLKVKLALELINPQFAQRVVVVLLQMIRMKTDWEEAKKLSKRRGWLVTSDEIRKIFSPDLFRFLIFSYPLGKQIVINRKSFLAVSSQKVNSYFYLKYVFFRADQIIKKAGKILFGLKKNDNYSSLFRQLIASKEIKKKCHPFSPSEALLGRIVFESYERILSAAASQDPSLILSAMKMVARVFHSFYQNNRILDLSPKKKGKEKIANWNGLLLILNIRELFLFLAELLGFNHFASPDIV